MGLVWTFLLLLRRIWESPLRERGARLARRPLRGNRAMGATMCRSAQK